MNDIKPDSRACVLPSEIEDISKCHRGKAGGHDGLQHEHLIHTKEIISPVVANIFMWMLRTGHIPDNLKRGVIITLHKGCKKRRDSPHNYRAITLTSVLLKLYESVLLLRCKDAIMSNSTGRVSWVSVSNDFIYTS